MTDTACTLDEFWASIDAAWSNIDTTGARSRLLSISDDKERDEAHLTVDNAVDDMLNALTAILETYSSPKLSAWDAHCERALYDIDREDVHEVLDGSDDGFLYARGFVVACGKDYYEAVKADPAKHGAEGYEAEVMCYIASHLHDKLFGEWPPKTGISRETASNPDGWA
jgi:hypothetical protein